MKYIKIEKLQLINWLFLLILSIIWICFSLIFELNYLINKKKFLFPFIIAIFSLIISIISICFFSSKNKEDNKEFMEKQDSIRDYYHYQKYLDPPDLNN
jgi:hypothetical protein